MKPKVYLETTIISYLTSRPSRDLIATTYQQITQAWWQKRRQDFDLFISEPVLDECSHGDMQAVEKRLAVLQDIPLLKLTDESDELNDKILASQLLPLKAEADVSHIAIATANGMDYLLTWNFKHIANAVIKPKIEAICRQAGFEPPVICTPEELLEILEEE